jgi:hypothetical protein
MRPWTIRLRAALPRRPAALAVPVAALAALALGAGLTSPVPARAAGCGGLLEPECPAAATPNAAPAECRDASGQSLLGTTDHNRQNVIPAPRLGRPLVARRADGHLPFGFNDASFFVRQSTPRVGLTGEQDVFAHILAGSTLIRYTVHWGWMERNRGSTDWLETDRAYCDGVRSGVPPILTILGSPKWAVSGGQRCDGYCLAPPDAIHDGDLRDFAQRVAIRYPKAAAIEAWNEPNLDVYWHAPLPGGAGPDPTRYTEVLRAIFEGVKSGNPGTPVLGGALGIPPGDFLSGMYDAGAQRWMDGLSFHPYPHYPRDSGIPDLFHKVFASVREQVATRDYPGRRLWPDEIGAGLAQPDHPYTEAQQAEELLAYYRELDAMPDVDAVTFHTLIDANAWGWLKPRDAHGRVYPRPVYCAFADRFGPPPATAKPKKKARKKAKKKAKHRRKSEAEKRAARKRAAKKRAARKRAAKKRAAKKRMDCSKPLSLPSS